MKSRWLRAVKNHCKASKIHSSGDMRPEHKKRKVRKTDECVKICQNQAIGADWKSTEIIRCPQDAPRQGAMHHFPKWCVIAPSFRGKFSGLPFFCHFYRVFFYFFDSFWLIYVIANATPMPNTTHLIAASQKSLNAPPTKVLIEYIIETAKSRNAVLNINLLLPSATFTSFSIFSFIFVSPFNSSSKLI